MKQEKVDLELQPAAHLENADMPKKKIILPIDSFKLISQLVVAVLLVVLGGIIGVKFSQTGKLPLGIHNLSFVKIPSFQNGKASDKLTGSALPKDGKVDFDVFWEVWGLLEHDYLEPEKLEADKMVHGAIQGMTRAVGDPYTAYLPPEDNQRSGEDLAGSFYGVGIELGYNKDGTVMVVAPIKGSPGEQAGIKAGDLIIHVKDEEKELDEDTNGWTLDDAVNNIRGEKGKIVTLTVFNPDADKDPRVIDIARGEIIVESTELFFVEHNGRRAAHIELSRFGDRTQDEWDAIVKQILAERAKGESNLAGIVLDMRNNPGGFLDTSIDLAGDFFKKGVVVSEKGRNMTKDFNSKGKARLAGIPTVVLVNRGSASASEILAGALRDNLGYKLIGENTFGKGTIQDRRELSNGGGIHITVGRWLLPKGEWIHDEGIPVDVEIIDDFETEDVDEALLKAIEEL